MKVTSRSRERRARVMDGIAVALLLAVSAALGVCAMLLAAPAKAEVDAIEYDFATQHGWDICQAIDNNHTVGGVVGITTAISQWALIDLESAVDVMNTAVIETCPRNWPLLQEVGRQARADSGEFA